MKKYLLLTAALLIGTAAAADNRTTRAATTLPEYVEKVGCVIVDKGGYSNVEAIGGGFCEGMKEWVVEAGRQYNADPDNDPDTDDGGYFRDNN